MDLGEPCRNVAANELTRIGHGLGFWLGCEGQRSQVISAQEDTVSRKSDLLRDAEDEIAEVCRLHSRVASILIDLICRCFDQYAGIVALCTFDGSFDHIAVGAAGRIDADGFSCFLFCNNLL